MFLVLSTDFQQKLSRAINIKKNSILDKKISNEFVRSVTGDEKNKSDSELVGRLETRVIIECTTNQLPLKENLVSSQAVREYLRLVWQKYQAASRREKSSILDELARNLSVQIAYPNRNEVKCHYE